MAEIFYEKKKKYNCRVNGKPYFRTSVTINGKVKQIYGDGEKDALRKKSELLDASAAGYNLDYQKSKVGDVFRYWLYSVKRVDKDIKASTFTQYESLYRTHIAPYGITNLPMNKLTFEVFQAYVTSLYEDHSVKATTSGAVVMVWGMFVKWAVKRGYLVSNPCEDVSVSGKYDKQKKSPETFTEEERAKLLTYMKTSGYLYDTLVRLAFATGMREGELLGLRWDHVHEDEILVDRSAASVTRIDGSGKRARSQEVWATKTRNSVRTIPILPATRKMLEEHHQKQRLFFLAHGLPQSEYVFTTKTGALIENSSLTISFQKLLRRAGIEHHTFHAIRHTFATAAIRSGVDVKDLQMLMGHSDLHTTYIYVQSDDTSRRDAINRLGEVM